VGLRHLSWNNSGGSATQSIFDVKWLGMPKKREVGKKHELVRLAYRFKFEKQFKKPCKEWLVTEPPKSLGPPTIVLVQWTSDNPVDAPDHLTNSVSIFFTFPKSVSPVMRILQHIGGANKQKQLQ
jgi:hypothetical protein